ncbi:MAG: caspase family protein [Rhodospirillales bacterium]|nr:caspase family protein [Rhodospirillales bacterium]
MRARSFLRLACAALMLLGATAPALAQAAAAKKVALVIGNSTYKEQPLKNPANDARAMAAKLRQIGFQVIERQNATKTQMEKAVADFGEALNAGAIGLFYYAGHGLQVSGRNFLVPVDAQITSEQRVRLETVDVDVVLDQMDAAKSGVNLVILDACRNNPFERRFRAAGGGLAQINAPQGTLIAYATAPGKVAADGDGANGLYTTRLLQHIGTPGVAVEEVFKRVRIDVSRDTNADQTPWESSSLVGSFMFVDAPPPPPPPPVQVAAAPVAPPPPAPAAAPAIDREALFWQSVKDSDDPAMLNAYLAQFPSGTFAPLARAKLAAAEKQQQAVVQLGGPTTPDSGPRSEPAQAQPSAQPQGGSLFGRLAQDQKGATDQARQQQLAAAPVPRALTQGSMDGTWQGSYACGPSQANGMPAFDSPGRVFQVRDGRLSGRANPPNGGTEEFTGTISPDGTVTITGQGSNPKGPRPYNISLKGKAVDGRFKATGRHGDRDCTLTYAKIQ